MAFENEFETQWNSVAAFLESEMIAQSNQRRGIDLQEIEQKFENEKKRWLVPGQFHYAWLELLRKKNPMVAEEFLQEMGKARLEQVMVEPDASSISVIATVAGGAVIGLGAGFLFHPSIILKSVTTLGGGIIGGVVGNGFRQKEKSRGALQTREQYVGQLQEMGNTLKAIVKKADD